MFIQAMNKGGSQSLDAQAKAPGIMSGKSDPGSFDHAKHGVSRIYKLIRGNRLSRNKFIASVVRKFDTPSLSDSVVSFLMYAPIWITDPNVGYLFHIYFVCINLDY